MIGRSLTSVCPAFEKPIYIDMLNSAIHKGQSRFCSSRLHKPFIVHKNEKNPSRIRQNMIVNSIYVNGESYAMIQIIDITDRISTEHRLTNIIAELEKGYEEAKKAEEFNKKLAERDVLTGLLNRHGLIQRINSKLLSEYSEKVSATMLFMDLDGFKNINDNYGHLIGDMLLVQVSERLRETLRKTDIISRLGGDEFVVVLIGTDSKEACISVVNKIIKCIAKPFQIESHIINITASIGIARYEEDIKNADELIKRADYAMYLAKKAGKNGYKFLHK